MRTQTRVAVLAWALAACGKASAPPLPAAAPAVAPSVPLAEVATPDTPAPAPAPATVTPVDDAAARAQRARGLAEIRKTGVLTILRNDKGDKLKGAFDGAALQDGGLGQAMDGMKVRGLGERDRLPPAGASGGPVHRDAGSR